jgi:2-alkyl-3-oxoalkanoate reductase
MNILVTGAAGLLGGALVAALTTVGHPVIGLVHRTAEIVGNDGRALPVTAFDGTGPPPATAKFLRGDIRRPDLGLDPKSRAWLDRHIDVVIHCAALVQFEASADDLLAVNVDGTRHVAMLCPNARFIHVSTAYVCGLRDGLIAESACDPDGAFGNGYERSKARAETVLRQMRPDAIIARPSIIVGEAECGRIRSFDAIYRAFKFIAEGKIAAVPVSPTATLNFVPIDHVVAGIGDLCDNSDARGAIVHLAASKAVGAMQFLALIGQIPGLCSPRITAFENSDAAGRSLAERLAQPYFGYFRRSPEFEVHALTRLSGRVAPHLDNVSLARQIRYCVDAGFIRSRRVEPV